jgi:2-succinyl-6-hydroxy-2,4-cyclohexadiene-1-carboxylate synthase
VPIRLVPGFSQPASVWDDVVAALPTGLDAHPVDVPDGLDFADTAAALAAGGSGPALWVGYSLGGRLALQLAVDHPGSVTALVLVSTTAGIADTGERANRATQDESDARTIERDGVDAFLAHWVELPIFATLPPERRALAARTAAMSTPRLAHQMRALGQGAMAPLWDRLASVTVPVTVVTGDADAKYTAIGEDLAAALPRAEHVSIPGGHSLPLESPAALAAVIARVHAALP